MQLFSVGEHEVKLGVRPEAFYLGKDANDLSAYCVNIESLGHEKIIYFNLLGTKTQLLTLRANGNYPALGKLFKLGINTEQLHFFSDNGDIIKQKIGD